MYYQPNIDLCKGGVMCDHYEVDLEASLAAIAEELEKHRSDSDTKDGTEQKPPVITSPLVKGLVEPIV